MTKLLLISFFYCTYAYSQTYWDEYNVPLGYRFENNTKEIFTQYKSENKLDSSILKINYYTNPCKFPDSLFLYSITETLNDSNGTYSIGHTIIDTNNLFTGVKFGLWKSYYSNGKLCSVGNYEIGVRCYCNLGGPVLISNNYRNGHWIYYYENGTKMGEGNFEAYYYKTQNTCGEDAWRAEKPSNDWIYYDELGRVTKDNKLIIEKINSH